MERLTQPEEDALRALWHTGPAFVKDVLALLPTPPPPYTTLASTLRNLERKQYVQAEKLGNSFRYAALAGRAGARAFPRLVQGARFFLCQGGKGERR